MAWNPDLPQGNAAYHVRYDIVPYTRGRVLEIGCGPWKAYPHFISLDNHSEWNEYNWKPDIMGDASNLDVIASKSMDAVFSSHLLEHIEDYHKALKEWWRVIKVGGYLALYLPHKEYYPNRGEDGSNPDHYHDFLPKDIISAFKSNTQDWDLVESQNRNGGDEFSFFQVYKKLAPGSGQKYSYADPKPQKSCAVFRHGGIGDMLQASSVIAGLKRDGYHIELYTTETGADVVRYDPNIDRFVIQDYAQVPSHELPLYWKHLEKKYDKFVNLSESVEGPWLAIEGRTNHTWSHKVRQKYMNVNYLEFAYDLAGLDMPIEKIQFYETDREKRIALKRYESFKRKPEDKVVLWVLSGSSLHKAWPYTDAVLAEFMLKTDNVNFVLAGDGFCKVLEQGWENEPRVRLTSGRWSVRETLAFAKVADLVIAPETSVINIDDIPRIVFLSHASKENLTKYWSNYIALKADDCPCYPCHMLHVGFEHCTTAKVRLHDGTAEAAWCQALIKPPVVLQAIVDMLGIKAAQEAA